MTNYDHLLGLHELAVREGGSPLACGWRKIRLDTSVQ
jgi:hypothetical protein